MTTTEDNEARQPKYGYFDVSDESLALGPGLFWCPDHPSYVFGMKGTGWGPPCPVCGEPTEHQGHHDGSQHRGQINRLRLGGQR